LITSRRTARRTIRAWLPRSPNRLVDRDGDRRAGLQRLQPIDVRSGQWFLDHLDRQIGAGVQEAGGGRGRPGPVGVEPQLAGGRQDGGELSQKGDFLVDREHPDLQLENLEAGAAGGANVRLRRVPARLPQAALSRIGGGGGAPAAGRRRAPLR
jgi:hypothetical protein